MVYRGLLTMKTISVKRLLNTDRKYLIIDVRGVDHDGGHITGSVNIPYDGFSPEKVMVHANAFKVDGIVFHCMFSSLRGPGCAKRTLAYLSAHGNSRNSGNKIDVFLLKGGFSEWINYPGTKTLTENFDEEIWIMDSNSSKLRSVNE